jgi:hypothetical protein
MVPFASSPGEQGIEEMSQTKYSFPRFLMIILFTFVFLSSFSVIQSAEVYKWKDKKGNIVFSDSPPPADVDAEVKHFKQEPAAPWRTDARGNTYQATTERVGWTPA